MSHTEQRSNMESLGKWAWPLATAALLLCSVSGCTSMGASGPSARNIRHSASKQIANQDIRVLDLTDSVARRVIQTSRSSLFSEALGEELAAPVLVGRGDVLDISIWEAPPAALFGSAGGSEILSPGSGATARGTAIPQQMVDDAGNIAVPFAGTLHAAGRPITAIESDIANRLAGKAHQPQVIVRIAAVASSAVTVVGDVATSSRVPLTAKGERLLDVLASVGGVKQPVGKTTIQITRGQTVASLPLQTVISDPRQNIYLQPNDVVTALFKPFSFTALGATGINAEIDFEGTGLTLAQALGRIGGLRDERADVGGVFIFRLEEQAALDKDALTGAKSTPDGRIPVIYRLNLRDSASIFVAQGFPIRDKDVVYVSNAAAVDLQKFISIISQSAFSVIGITNAVQGK